MKLNRLGEGGESRSEMNYQEPGDWWHGPKRWSDINWYGVKVPMSDTEIEQMLNQDSKQLMQTCNVHMKM